MNLHGITGAPYATPRVQKKMPKPFARPSISVGGSGPKAVKRDWKQTPVHKVAVGDTVADVGEVDTIEEISESSGVAVRDHVWTIVLTNVFGARFRFRGETSVMAFTAQP